jgi:hypothetical protein
MAAFSTGTRVSSGVRKSRNRRGAGTGAGETDQLLGEAQHAAQDRAVRVEAGFTQTLQRRRIVAPAPAAVGQGVDLVRRQAQALATSRTAPEA